MSLWFQEWPIVNKGSEPFGLDYFHLSTTKIDASRIIHCHLLIMLIYGTKD